ncbi:hypothetical protein GGI07_005482 [Coemansia sp. Benny D115]|nr:hypothetical protein GGI07_005482 [Coemansia sp. Benny D115]
MSTMDEAERERLMTPTAPIEAPEINPSLSLSSLTRREENSVIDLRRKHSYQRNDERVFEESQYR